MSQEHQEEIASLYVLDLLEGAELQQFQSQLARDPDLQHTVRDLRETVASLAYGAPAQPVPPGLKRRVLDSIDANAADSPKIIRPSPLVFLRLAPWAVAAGFAVAAGWMAQRYYSAASELALRREQQEFAGVALKSVQQQAEAERIVTRRQLEQLDRQLAGTTGELAATRDKLADREQRMAALTQRLDELSRASADLGGQLSETRERLASVSAELQAQGDLARFKITALASMLQNSPEALAVAVWDPTRQEGVLQVQKLPALQPGQDYQLWVVDPQYPNPVDGGVFAVDPASGDARMNFRAKQPVGAVTAFAVTRERKGGVPKAEGPFVLLGK